MKIWQAFLAASLALLASQASASAENWVAIGTANGHTVSIDMNDIRKWIDGLVYFSGSLDDGDTYFLETIDCQRGVIYDRGGSNIDIPDWRDKGVAVSPGSVAEGEMKVVCAKVPSEPLPGHWVGIGFGQSIDRDSIRHESDGLVHFTTTDDSFRAFGPDAADCQKRLIYFGQDVGWQDRGREVAPGSFAEAELDYACANVH
jgi:hypothetical protein